MSRHATTNTERTGTAYAVDSAAAVAPFEIPAAAGWKCKLDSQSHSAQQHVRDSDARDAALQQRGGVRLSTHPAQSLYFDFDPDGVELDLELVAHSFCHAVVNVSNMLRCVRQMGCWFCAPFCASAAPSRHTVTVTVWQRPRLSLPSLSLSLSVLSLLPLLGEFR